MSATSTFDTLVLDLQPQERRQLLQKLQAATQVSNDALLSRDVTDDAVLDYDQMYKELGFFMRVFVFFKALLLSMSKQDVLRGIQVKKLIKRVEVRAKGLVDVQCSVLLKDMMLELQTLRHAAKYFYNLLDRTLEKERVGFFAFLTSLELELVHQQLMLETDPEYALKANPSASEADIRLAVNRAIDNALVLIGEEQRRSLYLDVHGLFVLKSLSAFPFDRLLKQFGSGFSETGEVSIAAVTSQLRELDAILNAFDMPPSLKLMETIFTFYFSDQIEDKAFDIEAAIRKELVSAEQALSEIRNFNAKVPLHLIVKMALNDPDLQCDPVAGGEDWFALFKMYWRERTEKKYQKWLAEKRTSELQGRIDKLVGTDWPGSFIYLPQAGNGTVPPVRFAAVLRCLDSFCNTVFVREINRVLKLILIEGEFYKRDNRLDFTDAYNKILQIVETLKKYDEKLAPDGEFGLAYGLARQEVTSLSVKRRKIESAIQAAETDAETIIRTSVEAMNRMHLVLKGILSGSSRERYDSLNNLSRMDGKANAEFIKSVGNAKDRFEQLASLVNELSKLALMNEVMLDVAVGQTRDAAEFPSETVPEPQKANSP